MIWQIDEFELRSREFDFSSSGLGTFRGHEVTVAGVRLINMVERLEIDDDRVQLIVCEECGIPGCAVGNWASIRRLLGKYVLVPAVLAMLEGAREQTEYTPPRFMSTNGLPAFSKSRYERLREAIGKLPEPELVQDCSSREILGLLRFDAPGRSLGGLGDRTALKSEAILAVSEGELENELAVLRQIVSAIEEGAEGLHSDTLERVVEFHLDIPGFPSWKPLGYGPQGPKLNVLALL